MLNLKQEVPIVNIPLNQVWPILSSAYTSVWDSSTYDGHTFTYVDFLNQPYAPPPPPVYSYKVWKTEKVTNNENTGEIIIIRMLVDIETKSTYTNSSGTVFGWYNVKHLYSI